MLTLRRLEFDETRLVLRGEASMRPMYQELAKWIEARWNLDVLNVTTAAKNTPNRYPEVWLLREEDVLFLRDDREKVDAIVAKFGAIVREWKTQGYDADRVRVGFAAFVPLAMEDAVERLPDTTVDDLKQQAENSDLWAIVRSWGRIVFLFVTDEKARSHEAAGLVTVYRRRCFDLLKAYDECELFRESDVLVEFDSKEEVERNFQGSLSYYAYHK